MDLTVQGGQSPASYMESAADWPPPISRVSLKSRVAQFCAAPWPNFTPPLTVDWFNNRRLLQPIRNIPPAEAEETFYEQHNEFDKVA